MVGARRRRGRARRPRQKNKQKFHWRTSIVDLMKLLDLDSSAAARKTLAEELHYTGDMKDSAKMNIWLHKQVMIKLAENGGKVPDESLLDRHTNGEMVHGGDGRHEGRARAWRCVAGRGFRTPRKMRKNERATARAI
jgi:hypothetical protein